LPRKKNLKKCTSHKKILKNGPPIKITYAAARQKRKPGHPKEREYRNIFRASRLHRGVGATAMVGSYGKKLYVAPAANAWLLATLVLSVSTSGFEYFVLIPQAVAAG
jgi:hypothetical protein